MSKKTDLGMSVIGLLFFGVGIWGFLTGGGWIHWLILGMFFGGIGAVKKVFGNKEGADAEMGEDT